MRVLYALLCEDAKIRDDGRLDASGVFHQLYAPGFPARQDALTLAAAIEWAPEERGEIPFSIDLVDPSGSPALTINGETEVGGRQPLQGPPQTRLVMPLADVVFPAEGTYDFVLRVNGEEVRLTPLHLIHNPQDA